MKKVYYQLKMYQKSPLRVGSGDNEITDSDLMMDGRGCPFIPGSSVAGVLRDLCVNTVSSLSENDVNKLFGDISEGSLLESHVLVSDAAGPKTAAASDYKVTIRDGIRLDEWGMTVHGNKYDFQVTETKIPYYSVLEWSGTEEEYQKEIIKGLDLLMKNLVFDGISFGARTTRGYGKMSVTVKRIAYDFPEDLGKWLDFDPLEEDSFANGTDMIAESQENTLIKICADIKIEGSFSVRVNTARAERFSDGSVPDSVPLCNSEEKPVIPGTSWAGVFRHHMLALLRHLRLNDEEKDRNQEVNHLFGMGENGGESIRSAIRFSETVISGGASCSLTRNAVDRFTQAPRNTALFTNRLWQGGQGRLEIVIEKNKWNKLHLQLLAVSLMDLDLGILSFGGAAGTGHGRCSVTGLTVNGENKTSWIKEKNIHFLEEFL
ncbi:MAG TPA: hypothetical protein IAA00_08035 [Candidatus Blautia ornithocaccae]|nr:hypothetical protein [Candidatus Blautia ornithocaccae]